MSLDALFGAGTPLAVRFILAFVIVLALIGVLVLILRRVGPNAVRNGAVRRGPARLGVLEVFQLDTQRKLVILRRDSTEHLVMIGGPNDVLVEANIVRAQPAAGSVERAAAAALAQQGHIQQAPSAVANGAQAKAPPAERPAARAEPVETAPAPAPPQPSPAQPTPAPIVPRLIAAQSPQLPPQPPTSGAQFDAALDRLRGGSPS